MEFEGHTSPVAFPATLAGLLLLDLLALLPLGRCGAPG